MGQIRWGIIGTGNIAHSFATGLKHATQGALHAVGSRDQGTADAFGREFGIKRCHPTYESLVHDPEVEIVYLGVPNSFHKECAILALEAGKPVLCEKPFMINAAEGREVVEMARRKGLFLMEAMWTRFFPIMTKLRQLVSDGAVGEIKMVEADFGFLADGVKEPRLYDLKFGGGSLLDVGIYPISLFSMLLGKPNRIASMADIAASGVDEQGAVILGHPGGVLAVGKSGFSADTQHEATVVGTTGYIRVAAPFWQPKSMTLFRDSKEETRIDLPYDGNGYQYEADEAARSIAAGKTESEIMPLKETIEILETMDAIRAQWGVRYPME